MTDDDMHGSAVVGHPLKLGLPYRTQLSGLLRLTAVMAVAALVLGLSGLFGAYGSGMAIAAGVCATVLLTVAGAVWLLSRSLQGHVRQMEAGRYRAHWRYDEATWSRYRADFERRRTLAHWWVILGVSLSGLVVGVLAHDDGSLIGDSVFWTYTVTIGGGAAIGSAIAFGMLWMEGATARLMAHLPGEAVIGDRGLYITGQYWPWRSFGMRLRDVCVSEQEPRALLFTFEMTTGHRISAQTVSVPVPPGEEAAAERLADEIGPT